jgi:hypothetical protein
MIFDMLNALLHGFHLLQELLVLILQIIIFSTRLIIILFFIPLVLVQTAESIFEFFNLCLHFLVILVKSSNLDLLFTFTLMSRLGHHQCRTAFTWIIKSNRLT